MTTIASSATALAAVGIVFCDSHHLQHAEPLFHGRRTAVLSIHVTGDAERYRKPSMWCSVDLLHIPSEVCCQVLSFQSGRTEPIALKMPNSPAGCSAFFDTAVLYRNRPIVLDDAENPVSAWNRRGFPEPPERTESAGDSRCPPQRLPDPDSPRIESRATFRTDQTDWRKTVQSQ